MSLKKLSKQEHWACKWDGYIRTNTVWFTSLFVIVFFQVYWPSFKRIIIFCYCVQLIAWLFLSNRKAIAVSFLPLFLAISCSGEYLKGARIPCNSYLQLGKHLFPSQVSQLLCFDPFWAEDIDSLWNPCQYRTKTERQRFQILAIWQKKKKGIPLLRSCRTKILITIMITSFPRGFVLLSTCLLAVTVF